MLVVVNGYLFQACKANVEVSDAQFCSSSLQVLEEVGQGSFLSGWDVIGQVGPCVVSRRQTQVVVEEGLHCLATLLQRILVCCCRCGPCCYAHTQLRSQVMTVRVCVASQAALWLTTCVYQSKRECNTKP